MLIELIFVAAFRSLHSPEDDSWRTKYTPTMYLVFPWTSLGQSTCVSGSPALAPKAAYAQFWEARRRRNLDFPDRRSGRVASGQFAFGHAADAASSRAERSPSASPSSRARSIILPLRVRGRLALKVSSLGATAGPSRFRGWPNSSRARGAPASKPGFRLMKALRSRRQPSPTLRSKTAFWGTRGTIAVAKLAFGQLIGSCAL